MSYVTLEVEIDHGRIVPREPAILPDHAKGLLTILQPDPGRSNESRKRVVLPLIQGDKSRIIDPTSQELDASLWS